MSFDAIIVGGGHNGLICAAYLARAGRKTLVLERRHVLGGAAVSEQVFPGFTFSVASYVVSLLRPAIVRDLDLPKHGYDLIPLDATFSPDVDGPGLLRTGDWGTTRRELARLSPNDAEAYPLFGSAMARLGRTVASVLDRPVPERPWSSLSQLRDARFLLKDLLKGDASDRALMMRMMTMSATDLLDRWFESDRLKAAMSVSGIIGTFQGVRSPTTAYVLLHHYMGQIDGSYRAWGWCRGGTGAVSNAIADAARSFGAEIVTEADVDQIIIEGDDVRGVALKSGREYRAPLVVSGVDPHRTFHHMVGREHLPDAFHTDIQRMRMRGSSAKVNLALDGLPEFTSRPAPGEHLRGDITICPSIDYLERAFDDAVDGQFSRRPFMDIMIPSLIDPSIAPPNRHVMSIFVQYAPYHLTEGTDQWPQHREALGDAVMSTLEMFAPGISDRVLHRQVVTPWDLEQTFGLTEGNIFHGELSLEQLMHQRPAPGWSRYRTPVRGLYLCASGTHPGGGIMGAPGRNAAMVILGSGGRS